MNQNQLDTACRAVLAEEADQRLAGDHPSPELLAAYQEHRLAGDARQEVRQHLLDCRDCMAIWRGLRLLEEEPAPAPASSEFERALFRRSLVAHRAEEGAPVTVVPPPRRPFLPTALAAALFAAVVGLALWNLEQRRNLAALAAPQSNVTSHYLAPSASQRSAGKAATPEILQANGNSVLQISPPLAPDSAQPAATTYTLRILDRQDRQIWRLPGNRLNDLHSLTLYLPPGTLAPGPYRLELLADTGTEVLEDYLLEVR